MIEQDVNEVFSSTFAGLRRTAHMNGSKIMEFYSAVLSRTTIDAKGLPLVAVVNVGPHSAGPE